MTQLIGWITSNWSLLGTGLLSVILLCSIVVKITPSTRDDAFITKIISFLDKLSLCKTARDKELISFARDNLKKEEHD